MMTATRTALRRPTPKAARVEYEQVLATMVDGIVVVDPFGRIRTINAAARELLRISSGQCEGMPFREVVGQEELQRFLYEALAEQRASTITVSLPGELRRVINVRAAPLSVSSTGVAAVLLILHEITAVMRLERMRRDFVANLSHELRTPVTSIAGFVETLRDGAMHDPELLERFLGIIGRHTERLARIFDDLMMLTRLESVPGDDRLRVEHASLKTLVQHAFDLCSHRAVERKVRVSEEIPNDATVFVNSGMMEIALVNLIGNAVTYCTPDTTVRVRVVQRDNTCEISVSDEGPGIDRSHLERIFERFYRVDSGRSRNLGGTGLGLAIVKHIALVHGGHVTVDSDLGRGSTFTLVLPSYVHISCEGG